MDWILRYIKTYIFVLPNCTNVINIAFIMKALGEQTYFLKMQIKNVSMRESGYVSCF